MIFPFPKMGYVSFLDGKQHWHLFAARMISFLDFPLDTNGSLRHNRCNPLEGWSSGRFPRQNEPCSCSIKGVIQGPSTFGICKLPVKEWGSPNMSPNLAHSAIFSCPVPWTSYSLSGALFAKEGQGLGNVLRRTVLLHHNSCTSGRLKGSIVYLQWAPVKQESSNLRPLLEASMPARQFVRTLGTFKDFFFRRFVFCGIISDWVTWGVFSKIFGELTMKIGKMIISSHLPSCLHFLDKFQFQTTS